MRNYQNPQYKQWRKNIKSRDNYCCKWPHCGLKKGLQVHHILPWSQYPGLRFHIDNGITLCKFHHQLIKNDETSYSLSLLKIINKKHLT